MQYALLGDIHSSLEDLTAVLKQISIEAPDAVLIGTGDLYECTVSKKKLHGQVYESVEEVIKHPKDFDASLTFPSIYGNQEERILLITERAEPLRDRLGQLPETLCAGEAIVIHGHQWQPEQRAAWLAEHLPEASIVFHGHTHRSGFAQDGEEVAISGSGELTLSGRCHVINVGAVVESKEWVLFDADKRTVRFMQA